MKKRNFMDQNNTPQQPPVSVPPPPMTAPAPAPLPPQQQESSLSIVSLILGILSLTGFGFLLGIPAIITGGIALKKHQPGRGLSIAGIITGAISTLVSLLAVGFLVYVYMNAATYPEHQQQPSSERQTERLEQRSQELST